MRKDVRIGAVIGGILIAVMIVYAIVATRSHGDTKKNKVVLDNTSTSGDSTGGADSAAPAHDDHPDPLVALTHDPLSGGATPPTAAHADDAGTSAASTADGKSATNWGALLSADHVEDMMPVKTHTPGPERTAVDTTATPTGGTPHHLPPSDPPAAPTGHTTTGAHVRGTTPSTGGTTHRVASGETLSSIAQSTYGNARYYKEIIKANPKVDPAHLKPGMLITLPDKSQLKHDATPAASAGATSSATTEGRRHSTAAATAVDSTTEYRVQANDNLYRISMKLYHSANRIDAIYQLNKAAIGTDPGKLKLNMVLRLPEAPTRTAPE